MTLEQWVDERFLEIMLVVWMPLWLILLPIFALTVLTSRYPGRFRRWVIRIMAGCLLVWPTLLVAHFLLSWRVCYTSLQWRDDAYFIKLAFQQVHNIQPDETPLRYGVTKKKFQSKYGSWDWPYIEYKGKYLYEVDVFPSGTTLHRETRKRMRQTAVRHRILINAPADWYLPKRKLNSDEYDNLEYETLMLTPCGKYLRVLGYVEEGAWL